MIYFDAAYLAKCYLPEDGHHAVRALAERADSRVLHGAVRRCGAVPGRCGAFPLAAHPGKGRQRFRRSRDHRAKPAAFGPDVLGHGLLSTWRPSAMQGGSRINAAALGPIDAGFGPIPGRRQSGLRAPIVAGTASFRRKLATIRLFVRGLFPGLRQSGGDYSRMTEISSP